MTTQQQPQSTVLIPSNPEDRKRIKGALVEISNSMTRIEAERDLIKETLNMLKEEFELPPKYMRKVARVYHTQAINQFKDEFSEIEALYETLAN